MAVLAIPVAAGLLPWRSLWPDSLPLALQWLLAILMADVGITLVHFASHRIRWLWRFHAVHRSVERLYGCNGLLKHPLHQALATLAGTLPLLLIGMPMDIGWLLGFAVSIQLLLQHSNVDMAIGPLARVWAVAPVHRLHHVGSASAGDGNFGLFTCLADHLLGTARRDGPRVAAGMIGIEDRPDFPRGISSNCWSRFAPMIDDLSPDVERCSWPARRVAWLVGPCCLGTTPEPISRGAGQRLPGQGPHDIEAACCEGGFAALTIFRSILSPRWARVISAEAWVPIIWS